ncbi:MAG: ribosome biogenesis GTPase YlqF [Oscillospiraceae bacterium]|nr:ribosome biogenesis GTPase YlqF [Oscillospiraceae bacterium]
MPSETIQWFPGHMAKTRRLITECLPLVDVVIEMLDARIPISSENPEIVRLTQNKPRLTLLSKSSLADVRVNDMWKNHFKQSGRSAIFIDSITGEGINNIAPAVKELLSEKVEKYEQKGMTGRTLKAMVVGIPNVGKSLLINKLSGAKKAKVEDRPGVTLNKQWVTTSIGIDLLDMPGVLWPKFDDPMVGEALAITGAIKDKILDTEHIAIKLCAKLRKFYPELLAERYKLGEYKDLEDYELFELIGRKRGFLISGGEVDTERTAAVLLDEFRAAKVGRISLERP